METIDRVEVKAIINDKVIVIDFAHDTKDAYHNLVKNKQIKYLGKGIYYTIDGVAQSVKIKQTHFWKKTSLY